MKKITLLFFMSLLSLTAFAQFPEGFEGAWPPTGWEIHDNGVGPAAFWQQNPLGNPLLPAHTGDHAAYLNKENVATGVPEDWLVTPAFTVPTNAQLRFWSTLVQGGDQGSIYRIYITTNTTDPWAAANYTQIQQWTELEINPIQDAYVEKVVNIPATYTGQSVKLAFVMIADNGDRWLVDDVNVVSQCLDPTNLGANSFGLTTANLTWTNNSGPGATWEIEVIGATEVPTGTGTPYTGASPYPATGLTQDTDYKFYVRAVCSDGGTSAWVGPFYFSTVALGATCNAPIEITTLPYSNSNNTSNFGDDYNGSPGASGCGSTSGYLNGDDVVYSYTAAANGTISINLSGFGTFTGMFVYTSCANIGVNCAGGVVSGGATTPIGIPSFAVTAGQTYYIVISTWAAPQSTAYNLVVQQVNCAPPASLTATNIGMNSAQLGWSNPSGASSWEVVVQAPGTGIPTGAGTTATTNTGYMATSLTPATQYEYYVRADCGNGTFSAWAGPFLFNTNVCAVEDQCSYSFIMTDSFGDGWNGNTMTVAQNGITVATLGPTFTGGTGPITVTVPMCNDLPFTLYWNSGGAFAGEVGVSVVNSFSQTIFTKPAGTGVQNSLLYTGTVDCDTPACLPPGSLTVTNISTDQVDLGWAGPATGNWDYVVVPAGDPAPTASTPGTNTTTNPTTAGGLTAGTNYQFYVRLICAGGSVSDWAGPFAFNTAVCALADQCLYDFIMTDSFGDGWNGNTMTIAQNGATVAVIGSTFTTGTGPVTVSVPLCTGEPFTLFWNAGGAFAGEVGISVENNFDQVLFTKPSGTGSQNTLLFTWSEVDCANPACLPPTGLAVADETTTTAELSWAGPATGNWEYYVVEAGDPAPTNATSGTPTTTNPVTATGLTAATNYQYYVRVMCDPTNPSGWAGPFSFNTTVCEPADQCNYVFEMTDSFGDGWNGNTMTISQGGVPVATIGNTFTGGTGPVTVEVPLCPDVEFTLFWNAGGAFANEVGVTIYTPFAEDVFTKAPGVGSQNTLLYTGTANCTPPPCPKPQNVTVSNIDLTTADVSWTEMGSATTWEVAVLPIGSPEPTGTGTSTTDNPFGATDLEPGTPYVVYVRANCGDEDGYSNWAGPIQFVTALENDDCDGATEVPVNPDLACDEFVTGTITGATGSGVTQSCVTWQDIEYDVWYEFTATAETHSISITNVTGGVFLQYILFEGDNCGALTQVQCGGTNNNVSGLTPGETYYIMVYTTFFNNPATITSFDLCVRTPEPPISVSDTEYTIEELVQDVLIGVDCALVSNVTSVSGSDFGQANSIGYFDQNGSSFPFQNGVVLATGGITEAPGPNPGEATFDNASWPGDADLSAIIAAGGNTGALNNATVLEFDFIPFIDELSFNFIFASNEYGIFQCSFSDAFAFILTGPTTSVGGDNLAVIPGTTIPVSVVNIRDNAYNTGCASVNPEYFDQYNPDDPLAAPIGYNGQTVQMQASASVIPGETYHIKMVIADYLDSGVNSAVFLEGGSFAIGAPDFGPDLTIDGGNAACAGEEVVLDTEMDPDTYDFAWYQDGDLIDGATEPSYTVTEGGTYLVEVTYENTECSVDAEVVVEFYPEIGDITNDPEDLTACDASGYSEFDLSMNDAVIMEGVPASAGLTLSYYATMDDAENETNPVGPLYTNTIQFQETIYVRIENDAECFAIKEFDIIVQDLTPEFDITEDFTLCENTSGTIEVTATNFDPASPEVSYVWTLDGDELADTTSTITVTEGGVYEVTINNTGCEATASVTVTVVPTPVADAPADVTACDTYTLPTLTTGTYYDATGGPAAGANEVTDMVVTTTTTFYVFAQGATPDCFDENSFTVTINTTPVVSTPGDQSVCDSYELPALASGNYFDAPGGTGTAYTAGDMITATTVLYVYAETGTTPNCSAEESFTVTVTPSPVAQVMADVTACDMYALPALDPGMVYYDATGGPAGTGNMLAVGTEVTSTMMVYIYTENGGTPNCFGESSFTVTINASPVVTAPGDQQVCDSYELPSLAVGNYYEGSGGTGVMHNAGEMITSTLTLYVYAETATVPNCTAEDSFTITVVPSPVAQVMNDVAECDSYTLTALDPGNNYYTGSGGTGDMLAAGDVITSTQMIYIYAQTGTTPNCTDETSFTVTINATPEFTFDQPEYMSCLAENSVITLTAGNYNPADATYTWTFDGAPLAESSDVLTPANGGFGTYELTVSVNGCSVTHSVNVVENMPDLSVMYEEGCEGTAYMVSALPSELSNGDLSFNPDTATYAWSGPNGFTATTQEVNVTEIGTYTVQVTTDEGCVDVLEVNIISTSCAIPRGISPGDNMYNESFDLSSLGVNKISIFNRYGKEVYSFSGAYTDQWHGQTNGGEELPTGTYFYSIHRTGGESKTGWVYINRKQ